MKIKRPKSSRVKTIIVVAILVILTGIAAYYIFIHEAPTTPDSVNVPTVVKDSGTSGGQNSDEQTKVEGKTPAQYSNESTNSTPAYSNEQFRIPD